MTNLKTTQDQKPSTPNPEAFGDRDLRAEADIPSLDENKKHAPRHSERKSFKIPSNTERPRVPSLLRCLDNKFSCTPIRSLPLSEYIPNSRAMYAVINELFIKLTDTRGFKNYIMSCRLPHIRLYYGIIFIYRIMLVMKTTGRASLDILNCIQKIETKYTLKDFIIAEPLIPFFQAICAFEPSDPRFGTVSPVLPKFTEIKVKDSDLVPPVSHLIRLPYILGMVKCCHRMNQIPINTIHTIMVYNASLFNGNGTIVEAAANASKNNKWKKILPGCSTYQQTIHRNTKERTNYKNANIDLGIPNYGIDTSTEEGGISASISTWFTYLQLDNGIHWIHELMYETSFLHKLFLGNTSLDSISDVGPAYASVITTYTNDGDELILEDLLSEKKPYLPLVAKGIVLEPTQDDISIKGISETVMKIGTLTQINAQYPEAINSEVNRGALSGLYFAHTNVDTRSKISEIDTYSNIKSVLHTIVSTDRI